MGSAQLGGMLSHCCSSHTSPTPYLRIGTDTLQLGKVRVRVMQIQFMGMTLYDCGVANDPKHPESDPACTRVVNMQESLRLQVSALSLDTCILSKRCTRQRRQAKPSIPCIGLAYADKYMLLPFQHSQCTALYCDLHERIATACECLVVCGAERPQ